MKRTEAASESVFDTQSLLMADVWIEAERLRLLKRVLPGIGVPLLLASVITFVGGGLSAPWQLWIMRLVMFLSLAAYFIAIRLCRQKRAAASSYLLVAMLTVIALVLALLFDDLIVVFAILGLLISFLAGVLISLHVGYSSAIMVLIIGMGLFLGEKYGPLFPMLDLGSQAKQIIDLFAFLITIFLGTHLLALNQQGTHRALNRLVSQSNELKKLNKELGREIAERERAEEALARLNVDLESTVALRTAAYVTEQEKSAAILKSVGDAIGMTDLDMQVLYVNDAFTALTGYAPEDIVGKPMYVLMAERLPARDRQVLRHTLAEGEIWRGELAAKRKDGRVYDATMAIAPMYDATGRQIGYVASHQDVSRAKSLERARSRFIQNVSHELRTPVATLKLYTHMLRKDMSLEKCEQYVAVLDAQSQRLESLIEDLLEITALDSGQSIVTWDLVEVGSLLQSVVVAHGKHAEMKNIALKVALVLENFPAVRGDTSRLYQALSEIVENAIVFTPPEGEITLRAEASEHAEQLWGVLSVHDTGPGIKLEEQDCIFERFYRGELAESGHIPGTGLGLSIVYEIMRAHGGRVTVKSQFGLGSTFMLWLPTTVE